MAGTLEAGRGERDVTQFTLFNTSKSTADISEDGVYRYLLTRHWDDTLPFCGWVMLNPSTADASKDDATVGKCIGFSKRWGFGGIMVANCFAFRATKPDDMKRAADPFGPRNTSTFSLLVSRCGRIVLAWGANVRFKQGKIRIQGDVGTLRSLQREKRGYTGGKELVCLGRTKAGFPRHPLMLAYSTPVEPYDACPE